MWNKSKLTWGCSNLHQRKHDMCHIYPCLWCSCSCPAAVERLTLHPVFSSGSCSDGPSFYLLNGYVSWNHNKEQKFCSVASPTCSSCHIKISDKWQFGLLQYSICLFFFSRYFGKLSKPQVSTLLKDNAFSRSIYYQFYTHMIFYQFNLLYATLFSFLI